MLVDVLVGVALTAWLFTVGVASFFGWYVYRLWKIMRVDIKALNDKLDQHVSWTKNEFGLRQAMATENERMAQAEAHLKARQVWRNLP